MRRDLAQRELAALKWATEPLGNRLAGKIKNVAVPIEKHVGALPLFDALRSAPSNGESLAVELDAMSSKIALSAGASR